MDFFPDLTKPLFEKNAFELATEAWLFDEIDYSGPLRATCPEFESHHSGE